MASHIADLRIKLAAAQVELESLVVAKPFDAALVNIARVKVACFRETCEAAELHAVKLSNEQELHALRKQQVIATMKHVGRDHTPPPMSAAARSPPPAGLEVGLDDLSISGYVVGFFFPSQF